MKFLKGLLITALVLGHAGCQNNPRQSPQQHAEYNQAMIQWMNNASIDNAIISQHTLYAYHFVAHSASLNDLGHRDVGVLANHYRLHPGVVNVRRGSMPESLYNARVESVREALVSHGVDLERIVINDRSAGGEGMSSERVVEIME